MGHTDPMMTRTDITLQRHLASASPELTCHLERTLAFELSEKAGQLAAPEWVQIFPAGPKLDTVDGRSFTMADPAAFVARQTTAQGQPILVDFDHLSSFAPDEGGDQTAAGWIEELEVRDGEVWARVVWTVRAADQIADRQWRFVSPEFRVDKRTGDVVALDALALVNRPAFQMAALARANRPPENGDPSMKQIATALGLSEDATEEDILTAIQAKDEELETAKASSSTPSTKDFMPRADYDQVLARAEDAEGKLGEAAKAARQTEVDGLISEAVKAGKIAPASKGHYSKLALASDEGFDEVKALCASLPKVFESSDLSDADLTPKGALDAEDKEMAAMMGVSEEDYLKAKGS